jgi:hypothetical protein
LRLWHGAPFVSRPSGFPEFLVVPEARPHAS